MNTLSRFASLSAHEQRLLLASAAGLVVTKASLHLLPFRTVWRSTKRLGQLAQRYAGDSRDIKRRLTDVNTQISRAARRIPGATCLPQALTGYLLLSSYGINTTLRIGVRRAEDIEAHAWLEKDGVVVLGGASSTDHFRPFEQLDDQR